MIGGNKMKGIVLALLAVVVFAVSANGSSEGGVPYV